MSKNSSYVINQPLWNKRVQSICACLFLLFSLNGKTQNLVPNGDFEDTLCCPGPSCGSQILCSKNWFTGSIGSPDFWHLCSWDSCNGPGFMGESIFDEKAENGIVGIFNFADGFDFSEYLEIKLTDSLKHGLFYQLSVDLKASYPFYACDAIDFLFTKDSIFEPALFNYGKFPQVSNPKGNIIADSTNWFTLVDTFRAEGGEKFMTIGSFRLGDSTVWSQGALLGSGQSYVLIDNIKLVEYVPDTPLPETPLPFNLFPNPNNGQFTVTYTLDTSKYHQLIFYNTIGQLVYSYELNPAFYSAGLDLSALSGGMYLYTLVSDGKRARSGKMVVVK